VSCQLSASSHDPFKTPKHAIEISSYEEMKLGPTSFSCSPYCSHLQQQQTKTAQNEKTKPYADHELNICLVSLISCKY
jgi:hypothetical protein